MVKSNLHIEIVRSSQSKLSSLSLESSDAIFAVLAKHYHNVTVATVNNLADLEAVVAHQPDLVFLGMKFVPENPALGLQDPNKIWLAEYFDKHDIAYTGSNQQAHELELNKPLAKQRVLDAGLNTSKFQVINQFNPKLLDDLALTFPSFVKPTNRGGGMGIDSHSVTNNIDELNAKVLSIATALHSDSLVEDYLSGREFSVAVLKKEDAAGYKVMPIELVAEADENGARMLSGAVKMDNAEVVLEVLDETMRAKVTTLALDVFHALGARDYGRIDIRLDSHGTPNFLEANLIPSLISGYGSFPKSCLLNVGLDHEPMILKIVRLGLRRNSRIIENDVNLSIFDQLTGLSFEPAL